MKQRSWKDRRTDATALSPPLPQQGHRRQRAAGDWIRRKPGLYRLPALLVGLFASLFLLTGSWDRILSRKQLQQDPDAEALLSLYRLIKLGDGPVAAAENASAYDVCRREYEVPNSGFKGPVLDSTVLMLFAAQSPPHYQYYPSRSNVTRRPPVKCVSVYDKRYLKETFDRVAASFLSSPRATKYGDDDTFDVDNIVMPFFDFFPSHEATFWEIVEHRSTNTSEGKVIIRRTATPLQMDLLYTYVNPAAPSFRRNLEMRNITTSAQRRYNDWEELRYSLRSVMGSIVNSSALQQYPARLHDDVATLEALGYEVDLRVRRTPWERGAVDERRERVTPQDSPFPLFRTIYLLLSDEDQVPSWLDLRKFPQMRVVLHRDMFDERRFPGVLPTMSSNGIEMGMYRVPGLSRFYVYLNNDFMVGNTVSFFDLFRPISPPRQRMRMVFEEITGPAAANKTKPCAERLTRRFLFMDAIVRSEVRKIHWKYPFVNDPDREQRSAMQDRETACLRNTSAEELRHLLLSLAAEYTPGTDDESYSGNSSEAMMPAVRRAMSYAKLLPVLTRRSWQTTKVFSIPDPNVTTMPWERGTPPTKYHHFKATSRFEGILPPFNLAHHPYLRDRYIERIMIEEIYPVEAHHSRLAYDRTMYPFSIMHTYAVITAAFARARIREEWEAIMTFTRPSRDPLSSAASPRRHPVALEWMRRARSRLLYALDEGLVELPQIASTVGVPAAVMSLGSLYGNTRSVHIQAPNLVTELALWWLPGARPLIMETAVAEELSDLYEVPGLALIHRVGDTLIAELPSEASQQSEPKDDPMNEEKDAHEDDGQYTSNSSLEIAEGVNDTQPLPRLYKYYSEDYRKLLHDVTHNFNPDPSYRFETLGTLEKVNRLETKMIESNLSRATYICLNDNFDTENRTDAEVVELKTAFKRLMAAITGNRSAGPWERDA